MDGKVLVRPPESQTLKRGEDIEFPVELERENDEDSVVLRLEELPRGLRADEVRLHHGESKATLRLHASEDAELVALHEARLIATAPGIHDALSFRLSVTDENGETGAQERQKGKLPKNAMSGSQETRGPKGQRQPGDRTKVAGKNRPGPKPAEKESHEDEDRDESNPGCCSE